MCGAKDQNLVALPVVMHRTLHAELYAFNTAVTVGSVAFSLFFRKKKKLEFKSPIAQAARTMIGRMAIAMGLYFFYDNFGYMYVGQSRRQSDNLGRIFLRERAMFSGMKHNYPRCKK